MDTLHVVPEIPMAWEAISWNSTIATFVSAEEGLVAVAVHCMSLTLMAKEASCRRELEILAGWDLALIWLEMGIHKFAGTELVSSEMMTGGKQIIILIIALELFRPVLAVCLWLILPWAMVKSVGLGSHIVVQRMLSGSVVLVQTRTANQFDGLLRGF